MRIISKNYSIGYKPIHVLFFIVFYWFYVSICLGYFLSRIFNGTNFSKNLEFKKKFSFKNIVKIIINFFLNFIKNWFIRIYKKFNELIRSTKNSIRALKIGKKKFKSIFKFKRNFQILKYLFLIYWEIIGIIFSLVNEILFLNDIDIVNWPSKLINFVRFSTKESIFSIFKSIFSIFINRIIYFLYLNNIVSWPLKLRNFVRYLMQESVSFSLFVNRSLYFFCFITIGIFGIIIGFILGLYRPKNEINLSVLLLILIIFNNGFDDILFEYLHYLSLETSRIQPFCKFSSKIIRQIDPRPLTISLKETKQIPLPFSIVEDPLMVINQEVLWHKSTDYQFKLFKFYQHVNQNI